MKEQRAASLAGRTIARLLKDESGQDLIEYALIGGLLALAAVIALKNVTTSVGTVFTAAGTTLTGSV